MVRHAFPHYDINIELIVSLGLPCDANGNTLPPGSAPPPQPLPETPWEPYANGVQFKTADFLYCRAEMSARKIDKLLNIWDKSMENGEDALPFKLHAEVYETIDATGHGDAPWKCFAVSYNGEAAPNCPSWQLDKWEVYYYDPGIILSHMLDNPDFNGLFDYTAYIGLDKSGKQYWSDFMSGNFAYQRSVCSFAL